MYKLFKLLGILFVLSLMALSLTGCDNPPWESGMILNLKVDSPEEGATVTTSTVTVNGRVGGSEGKGAKVTVNNTEVPVQDGKYSTNVTLTEGKNVITIYATVSQAKLEEKRTVTYAPAKQ